MKTVIDAVNYYGGHSFVNGKHEEHHTHIVSATGADIFYSAYASDIGGDSAVCTIQEFNKCVDMLIGDPLKLIIWKESKTPKLVYTQSMVDAGTLPSVGMECNFDTSFFTTVTSNKGTCEIIAYYNDKVWINIIDFDCVINLNVIEFSPLTPTIQLVDGKAYQFDAESITWVGYYISDRKSFFQNKRKGNKICGESIATNIVLLTPEDQS